MQIPKTSSVKDNNGDKNKNNLNYLNNVDVNMNHDFITVKDDYFKNNNTNNEYLNTIYNDNNNYFNYNANKHNSNENYSNKFRNNNKHTYPDNNSKNPNNKIPLNNPYTSNNNNPNGHYNNNLINNDYNNEYEITEDKINYQGNILQPFLQTHRFNVSLEVKLPSCKMTLIIQG